MWKSTVNQAQSITITDKYNDALLWIENKGCGLRDESEYPFCEDHGCIEIIDLIDDIRELQFAAQEKN